MNRKIISIITVIGIIVFVFSCAEKKESVSVETHPEGWTDTESENFHGITVLENAGRLNNCSGCHGSDFMGEGNEEMSCYSSGCHILFPHKEGFANEASAVFHGKYIADSLDWDKTDCQSCHGTDYRGNGYVFKNCLACHTIYPHPDGFKNADAATFHGDYIAETLGFDISGCTDCHGENYRGNNYIEKNCYNCHSLYPHKTGFASVVSENFHADFIADSLAGDMVSCTVCHGNDYQGNGYEEKNCQSCHALYPHTVDYADPQSDNFHGEYIAEILGFNLSVCKSCHGNDFRGDGNENKNCYTCHALYPHVAGFANEESDNFHGEYIEDTLNYEISSCAACHGEDYSGAGYEEKNCHSCHEEYPHPQQFTNSSSDDFHGVYLAEKYNWIMDECQECHGENYTGEGKSQKNCKTCHSGPDGPENCNTCHGSPQNDAPPHDLAGNTETTYIGVGAHQAHLQNSDISNTNAMGCSACHITPTNYKDNGHLDDTEYAEVFFDSLVTDSGRVNAQWNHGTATCSNIYCHGAFEFDKNSSGFPNFYTDSLIVGNNPDLIWTNVGTNQADCGTCHGLPPTGHIALTTCYSCHALVVDDAQNIIDKTRHINGKINAYED